MRGATALSHANRQHNPKMAGMRWFKDGDESSRNTYRDSPENLRKMLDCLTRWG